MPEIIVVDSEGRKISANHKKKPPEEPPTNSNLEKLEDAIFFNGNPYRKEFLNEYTKVTDKHDTLSTYLKTKRLTALKSCWQNKHWRPSKSLKRVIKKNPNNPYLK